MVGRALDRIYAAKDIATKTEKKVIEKNVLPVNVWENKELFDEFCAMIEDRGIQRYWDENNLEAGYERVKKLKTFA
jgi:hypothetical protein